MRLGIQIVGRDSAAAADAIIEAESLGFQGAWLTSGWLSADPFPILSAAARQTSKILLGTSIIPMLSRHPLAAAQGAFALQELSEGRFRLGVGTTTRGVAERILGVKWPRPLPALGEYVSILRQVLNEGRADFDGQWYSAHGRLPHAYPTPIYVAALNERAWENAGAIADGVISWMAPRAYLASIAVPALARGAQQAGRATPSVVAHVPVVLAEHASRISELMREQLGSYARVPEYQSMFAAAGNPVDNGTYSGKLLDDLVVTCDKSGNQRALAEIEGAGAAEVLLSVLDAGQGMRETMREVAKRLLT